MAKLEVKINELVIDKMVNLVEIIGDNMRYLPDDVQIKITECMGVDGTEMDWRELESMGHHIGNVTGEVDDEELKHVSSVNKALKRVTFVKYCNFNGHHEPIIEKEDFVYRHVFYEHLTMRDGNFVIVEW